jgi:hypothetical protein
MFKLKLDILKRNGKIYYSDTDSIVTDLKLPESMVSSNELGKLKLEHKISDGIFISGKLYSIIDSKGNNICKAKGIPLQLITMIMLIYTIIKILLQLKAKARWIEVWEM